MAELDRLLGFMSSWDRQAALRKYRSLFAASEDEQALMDELGTPTKLAIELAASYVPTRPPSALAQALEECPVALEDLLRDPNALAADLLSPAPETEVSADPEAPQPETWVFEQMQLPELDPAPAAEEPEAPQAPRGRVRVGALIGYLIPAVVIGLPVAVVLVCVGLPFLAAGAGLIFTAILQALRFIAQLRLVSDILLTVGAALIACGVGLALCWFGLWLSMELCWLWVGRALIGLGRRLCLRKEAAE
jgi:uncharacterized membrane protein